MLNIVHAIGYALLPAFIFSMASAIEQGSYREPKFKNATIAFILGCIGILLINI